MWRRLRRSGMAQSTDFSSRHLARCTIWHLRKNTLKTARTALVNDHHKLPLTQSWGSGMLSSSDGQRSPVSRKNRHSRRMPPPLSYGRGGTFYSWSSDQLSQDGTNVMPGVRAVVRFCGQHRNVATSFQHDTHTRGRRIMWQPVWTMAALLGLLSGLIWSAPLGAEPKTLADYDPKTLAIIANRDSSDLTVIEAASETIVARIPLGPSTNPHMAMVTHDGKKILVSATGRDRFLIVDMATSKIEHTVKTGKSPEHFDMTPDGRLAFVGNLEDSTVSVIDVHEGREVQRVTGFFEPHGFSVLPDGSKVYVSSIGAHKVAVLDATGKMLKRLAIGDIGRVAALNPQRYRSEIKGTVNPTMTPDGAFVYAASGDANAVAIIDTRTDQVVKTLPVGEQPWRAYSSPDGRWMLVPNSGDATFSVIETASQKIVAKLNAGSDMTGVNFALGGRKAYVISRGESTVYVYDMQTFGLVTRLKIGTDVQLETASTTADGAKIFLASSKDSSVYVINAPTDDVKRIANVGQYPWGVTVQASASPNYCH